MILLLARTMDIAEAHPAYEQLPCPITQYTRAPSKKQQALCMLLMYHRTGLTLLCAGAADAQGHTTIAGSAGWCSGKAAEHAAAAAVR